MWNWEDRRGDQAFPGSVGRGEFSFTAANGDTSTTIGLPLNGLLKLIKIDLSNMANDSNHLVLLDDDGKEQWRKDGLVNDAASQPHVIHFSDGEPVMTGWQLKLEHSDPGSDVTVSGQVLFQ